MLNMLSVFRLVFAVFFLTILTTKTYALTPEQIFDKVKDAIVVVKTFDSKGRPEGFGSGVIISSGKIATNYHVVEGGVSYKVYQGKQVVNATLYAEDQDKDICILNAKGIRGKPAQLGKAANLKIGVSVYAIGAPEGLELSISDGIVSQLRFGSPPVIQTTAAISHGSSGGGLFDREGRLVGLTSGFMKDGQSLNFAMPVEWINDIKPGCKPAAEGRSQIEWLKYSILFENLEDWKGLLDWTQQWTKSEPKSAEAWYSLGVAYVILKRYSDAIDAFRQSLCINPYEAKVLQWLGMSFAMLEHYTEAIDFLQQSIHINPEDAFSWSFLGNSYGSLNRFNDAIEAYRQSLRYNPENADVWYSLASCYAISGNRKAAIDAVRKLQRLDPTRADELFNLIVPR